ncbi:hypothetical protein [Runella aurantiaca]|uniref:DUF1682 domain-containing protein n=1 Tax=Runella aurantiaca TaxID=2282308 RepID=A0A369I9H1_9BACT|nr:hypothetical protein [Runella aurantiaca]RDB04895.1 hypothetical protein DVG78_16745 [Runella aurantiaca]
MNRPRNYRPRFWLFPLFAAVAALALGGVVKWLWNAILPPLLGVGIISFWQAVGLLVLCRILFGNFGRGSMGGNHRWNQGNRFQGGGAWREKWRNMTDEERAKLKEEWRKRCQK